MRIDEDGNKETYIFKRNGELVLSFNGTASVGKWEILIAANSLLIDRGIDKLLLKHDFIDNALMVLKRDDFQTSPFVLMNSNTIPDLNAEKYLKTRYTSDGKINEYNNESNVIQPDKEGDTTWDGIIFVTAFSIILVLIALIFFINRLV